jgi:hypothetical protein
MNRTVLTNSGGTDGLAEAETDDEAEGETEDDGLMEDDGLVLAL